MIKIEELIKWCGEVRFIFTESIRRDEPILKAQVLILLDELQNAYPVKTDTRYKELVGDCPYLELTNNSILADPEE